MVSSFLQDIPRHDARLVEVREAFKRTLLPCFRAYISAYIGREKKRLRRPSRGGLDPCGGLARRHAPQACCAVSPVAVPATGVGPLIKALVHTYVRAFRPGYEYGYNSCSLHLGTPVNALPNKVERTVSVVKMEVRTWQPTVRYSPRTDDCVGIQQLLWQRINAGVITFGWSLQPCLRGLVSFQSSG